MRAILLFIIFIFLSKLNFAQNNLTDNYYNTICNYTFETKEKLNAEHFVITDNKILKSILYFNKNQFIKKYVINTDVASVTMPYEPYIYIKFNTKVSITDSENIALVTFENDTIFLNSNKNTIPKFKNSPFVDEVLINKLYNINDQLYIYPIVGNYLNKTTDSILLKVNICLPQQINCTAQIQISKKNKPNEIYYSEKNIKLTGFENCKALKHIINTTQLPSGNYTINFKLINNDSIINNQNIEISRAAPKTITENKLIVQPEKIYDFGMAIANKFVAKYSHEQIVKNANTLTAIGTALENNVLLKLLKSDDDSLIKLYFYNFWLNRNANNPEQAWKNYTLKLNYVAETYGGGGQLGYTTDRGRIYLKYGAPTNIEKIQNEKDALPHEIWVYDQIEDNNNIVFIYFQKGLASGQYKLLHSNMPGEISTLHWPAILFKDPADESHRIFEFLKSTIPK
jgi:GWxTD domain-containing protein